MTHRPPLTTLDDYMHITDSPCGNGVEILRSPDPFYPDIGLVQLRQTMRLDGKVTEQRLRHSADAAVRRVQSNLTDWRTTQTDDAITEQQAETYLRAVYAYTAASVQESMAGYDSTLDGRTRAEELSNYAAQLMRDGHWAVRDLQGKPRTTVELI